MNNKKKITLIFLQTLFTIIFLATYVSSLKINEFTVDPQIDWDNSSTIGPNDEWVELYNEGTSSVNLTGWRVSLIDGTPANQTLNEIIPAGGYLIILNPSGDLSQNGQIILYNLVDEIVDSVTFGNWNDSNPDDNAPNGDAHNASDECLARFPNGQDTDIDIDDFIKTTCTFGTSNSEEENESEQGLNATISEIIVLHILPTMLDFGVIAPGSVNNPALNGPIIFNATGSNANVNIEVSEIIGYPFEQGLKIDGDSPVGKFWQLLCVQEGFSCTYTQETAVPTLDVPVGSIAGTTLGTIVYTVTGTP